HRRGAELRVGRRRFYLRLAVRLTSVSAVWSETTDDLSLKYEQAVSFLQRNHGIGRRAQSGGAQPLVDLEPGSAGALSTAFPARLAKPLSQRRRRAARSLGLRTARPPAGPRFCPAGAGRAG